MPSEFQFLGKKQTICSVWRQRLPQTTANVWNKERMGSAWLCITLTHAWTHTKKSPDSRSLNFSSQCDSFATGEGVSSTSGRPLLREQQPSLSSPGFSVYLALPLISNKHVKEINFNIKQCTMLPYFFLCLTLPQRFLSCLCSCCCKGDDNRHENLKGHVVFTSPLSLFASPSISLRLTVSSHLTNLDAYITRGMSTLYLLLQRDKHDESEKYGFCTFCFVVHLGLEFTWMETFVHFVSKQIKSDRPHGAQDLTGMF